MTDSPNGVVYAKDYVHALVAYMHGEEDINRMEDDFIESIRLISLGTEI